MVYNVGMLDVLNTDVFKAEVFNIGDVCGVYMGRKNHKFLELCIAAAGT